MASDSGLARSVARALGAALLCGAVMLGGCAMHWPWRHRAAPPPQAVQELRALPLAGQDGMAPAQYWQRNTLLLDLSALRGEGSVTLAPVSGHGWPVRLAFKVQSGSFAQLEVMAAQRVVFAVPASGGTRLLRLEPGALRADTTQLTLRWSAVDDSPH